MMTKIFDVCIVGAGMIGCAAARHASLRLGASVCLIGPTEPKTKDPLSERDIFGAYYDEGRITRSLDTDLVWAKLAQKSIDRYRELENQSGIKFYHEVGTLMIGTKISDFLRDLRNTAKSLHINARELTYTELSKCFPYLTVSNSNEGILEYENAGYVNPRKLVEAQKIIAARHGCEIIDDIVCKVVRNINPDGTYLMNIFFTEQHNIIHSRSVLLATGSYTDFRPLLLTLKPHVLLKPALTTLLEVEKDSLEGIRCMPAVLYRGPLHRSWYQNVHRDDNGNISFYMLPPIQYPDGKNYVKLGMNIETRALETVSEAKHWYIHGDIRMAENNAMFLKSVFKDTSFCSFRADGCIIDETPTNHPYIDMVHTQLGVAIGGNGYAAKSSDEIGRLAVNMLFGEWDSEIPRDLFKLVTHTGGNGSSITKIVL